MKLLGCWLALMLLAACKSEMCMKSGGGGIPRSFLASMCETAGHRRWKEVNEYVSAHRIAQYAKERFYLPNGLWGQDMEHAEETGRLQVCVLTSGRYTVVVWCYPQEKEMDSFTTFVKTECHGICYVSDGGDDPVSAGSGSGLFPSAAFNSERLDKWLIECLRRGEE